MLSFMAKTNRFHVIVALCWQFSIFFGTQMIFSIFSSYIPRWRCSDNHSSAYGRNCTEFKLCSHVQFEDSNFQSAALEFNWICGPKAYFTALYAQLQFFGVLTGTLLFGSLSDYFGRKPVSLFVLSAGISMMILSGLAPTGELLIASRFFVGLCNGGTVVAIATFVLELMLPEQRIPLRALFNWGIARLFLTIVCYYFPNWRNASFVCALVTLPAFLLIIFVLPESPNWLHSKGKSEEMRRHEQKIARIANIKYEEVYHEPVAEKRLFLQLLKDKALFKRVMVLWVMCFVASLSSYTNDLNSNSIVGNLFLNQLLFATFLVIAKLLLIPFDMLNFSRRNLHQYSQLIVVVCFLTLTLLVIDNEFGAPLLIVNLFGCAFIEYTWDACYLCAVESMPTNMRATSLGSCSLVARIGAVLAPTLSFMSTIWAPSAYFIVSIIGTISFLVSYLWLTETRGINLDCVKLHEETTDKNGNTVENGSMEEQAKMLQ